MSLNSKKSWDPTRRSNRARVAAREAEAAQQKERAAAARARDADDALLARLADDSHGPSAHGGLAWMYTRAPPRVDPDNVDVLLGTRRAENTHAQRAERAVARQQERKRSLDPLEAAATATANSGAASTGAAAASVTAPPKAGSINTYGGVRKGSRSDSRQAADGASRQDDAARRGRASQKPRPARRDARA